MSPAPQGGLEVERYIGSCLITSQSHRPAPGKQFGHKSKRISPPSNDISVRQPVLNRRDPSNHGGGGGPLPRYTMPPPPPMPGEFYAQHGWAGMPLFCMASANQRRHRKGPALGNRSGKPHGGPPQNRNLKCPVDPQEPDGNGRSPLSRLVVHTEGAPLILAGRYMKPSFNRGPPVRTYRGGDGTARRTDPTREPKVAQNKEPGASDGVASDESSANLENSLPRIIKPRKRRKKDRKLPPQSVKPGDCEVVSRTTEQNDEPEGSRSVSGPSPVLSVATDVCGSSIEEPVKQTVESVLLDEPDASSLVLRSGDDLPSEPEQDDASTASTASTCQCRYCDPVGVIWDVDRRCYSPFLTPPSPTETKPPYALRSYDLGPALRRSWSEPSSTQLPQVQPRPRAVSESQSQPPPQQQSLEVSSEIITSPNGHRDIEIKFFSSKPNSARQYKVEE